MNVNPFVQMFFHCSICILYPQVSSYHTIFKLFIFCFESQDFIHFSNKMFNISTELNFKCSFIMLKTVSLLQVRFKDWIQICLYWFGTHSWFFGYITSGLQKSRKQVDSNWRLQVICISLFLSSGVFDFTAQI